MSARETGVCAEMKKLLAERASGPLEASEAAVLDGHLAQCPRCRADAAQWEGLFALVALAPPTLREEAGMRDLPARALVALRARERQTRRTRFVSAAAGLLIAAAVPLVLWKVETRMDVAAPELAVSSSSTQGEWGDGPTWEMDEQDSSETTPEDTAQLDGLAFEGDGAFSPGDSG